MNEREIYSCNTEDKFKILIVSNRLVMRHKLTQLIKHESDLVVCCEAEDIDQVSDAMGKIDLVIVDIPLDNTSVVGLIERIKLRVLNVGILVLSVHDELLYDNFGFQDEAERYVIGREATEQITDAIRHIQSLLRSGIFGFTVSVKVERSVACAHEKSE